MSVSEDDVNPKCFPTALTPQSRRHPVAVVALDGPKTGWILLR